MIKKNQKYKNLKKTYNKSIFNIQAFNNKKNNKENIYHRNSNNFFQSISTNKSSNKFSTTNYYKNMNVKTSKIGKCSIDSYINSSSKRINNPKKIKRSNSIKIPGKFNEMNLLEIWYIYFIYCFSFI